MKVVCICILLLAPGLAMAQQGYVGATATRVLLPNPVEPADALKITIRDGEVIKPGAVPDSIKALYATGHYQHIAVDAVADGTGFTLTFLAQPYYFFAAIRLDPPNLLERPLSAYFRLPLGAKFSTAPIERIVEDTRHLLENQGYFNATLQPDKALDDNTRLAEVAIKASVGERARIADIQIEGGENTFSRHDLEDALSVKAGDPFSRDKLDDGLARVRQKFAKLGFLNTKLPVERTYDAALNAVHIHVRIEPGRFVLVSVRTPDGDEVDEISKDDLKTLIPVFEEGSADPELIAEGSAHLVEFLRKQGYFDPAVTPHTEEAPQDNAVQIIYVAVKGERRRLRSVHIEGATHISESDLRKFMSIRPAGLMTQGVFSRDLLETDKNTIEALYRNDGFLNTIVRVRQDEDASNHDIDITLTIDEGTRYTIERIVFPGATAIREADLRGPLALQEGQYYTDPALETARRNLMAHYASLGYSDVRIASAYQLFSESSVIVTFQIMEGEAYRIGEIFVSGNTITTSKTVRRNAKLDSGSPYDREALLAAQQRLYATGLFNRVDIVPLDQQLNRTRNVLIYVEDAKAILLSYGLGYKQHDGPRGTFEISHNNLWGLNRALAARVRAGRRERSFQMSYREPRLFNHEIQGFATLFVERAQRRFFNANTVDFSIQTVRQMTLQSSLILTASYQTVNLQDILVNPQASQFPNASGVIQIARIGASVIRDGRKDRAGLHEIIDPYSGSFHTTTLQVASKTLGSEVNFTSLFNQSTFYVPRFNGVVAMSTRAGWKQPYGGDSDLPISERFFAGGSTSLRAFQTDELRAGGGQLLTIANIEYRVPLNVFGIPGIGGALFYDTGNVFEKLSSFTLKEFTHTVGAGLRYQTPLGPVRVDLGMNLQPMDRIRNDGVVHRDQRFRLLLTLGNAF